MKAWVIKNKDGLYFRWDDTYCYGFDDFNDLLGATFYHSKNEAIESIKEYDLKNCKPVKVEIKESGKKKRKDKLHLSKMQCLELVEQNEKLQEENAKLKEQLKNTIVPKFEYGQTVYVIDETDDTILYETYLGENEESIITTICFKISCESKIYFKYFKREKDKVFVTKKEAQKYLEEHK